VYAFGAASADAPVRAAGDAGAVKRYLVAVVLIRACAPAADAPPATQVLVPGTLTTVELGRRELAAGLAHRGRLYALALPNAPAPYRSELLRYDTASRDWTPVFGDDAWFEGVSFDGGRAALVEYREPPQGGGAFDERLVILDLASAQVMRIDAFALSSATYRGGGGGPRRPTSRMILHGDIVAWTRLNELAGGVIEGELRIAPTGDPARAIRVATSRDYVEPLWLDDTSLIYALANPDQDVIRARDLATGAERTVAALPAPGQRGGRSGIARSGDVIAWIDYGAPSSHTLHTTALASGVTRDLDLGGACVGLTANAYGFAWTCLSKPPETATLSFFDPRAWTSVDIVRSSAAPSDLQAVDGGFVWFDLVSGVRRVNLLVLR
jgi:hypothetical protein